MMKKTFLTRALSVLTAAAMLTCVWGCGGEDGADAGEGGSGTAVKMEPIAAPSTPVEPTQDEPAPEVPVEEALPEIPEGMYASELTGLPISNELAAQRPIAVMVDNEIDALPHFGTASADIVYEMMNSTANNRITRLMVVLKDWGSIEQLGSIRSTRPTNIMLAAEYNAVLCHDGGPWHNDAYFAHGFVDHFSGTFSRVNNGKRREYTEYILPGDLDKNFGDSVSREYKAGFSAETPHFNFVEYGTTTDLAELYEKTYQTKQIILPFPHNSSLLIYNDETGKYEYCEYGEQYFDNGTGEPLAFTNVFLQKCSFTKLDDNGYLVYNCLGSGEGFYITDGLAKSVSWVKNGDEDFTRFYDDNGQEIAVNRGKTYIAIVPDDTWDKVQMNAEILAQ